MPLAKKPRLTARSSVKCQSVKLPGHAINVVGNDFRKILAWGICIRDEEATAVLSDENSFVSFETIYESTPSSSDSEISMPNSSSCTLSTTLGASVIISNAF